MFASLLTAFLSSSVGRGLMFAGVSVIAVGVAFGVGFAKGDGYRTKLDKAAAAEVQVELVNKSAKAAADASDAYQRSLLEAQARAEAAEKRANEAVAKSSDGACLDGDDVSRLRGIWTTEPSAAGHRKGH